MAGFHRIVWNEGMFLRGVTIWARTLSLVTGLPLDGSSARSNSSASPGPTLDSVESASWQFEQLVAKSASPLCASPTGSATSAADWVTSAAG